MPGAGPFVMSVPISLTTFNAVKPSTPSMRVRSTQSSGTDGSGRRNAARSAGSAFAIGSGRFAVTAVLEPSSWASISRSHSAILPW